MMSAWERMPDVGRVFGSPDYEGMAAELDIRVVAGGKPISTDPSEYAVKAMKPQSKAECLARTNGYEYRKIFQQGPGAAKAARNFSRLASNRAMRAHGKKMVGEGLDEFSCETS
jgi:hypothetical protein